MLCHDRQAAKWSVLMVLLAFCTAGWAQTQTAPVSGIRERAPSVHALVNATIVPQPGNVIENGTIVIRDGVIESVGKDVSVPADARIWEYDGLTVYAGFIEMYSQLGMPESREQRRSGQGQSEETSRGPQGWNENVKSQVQALDQYKPAEKDLETMRSLGFTAALVAPEEGIFRGSSALVTLGDGPVHDQILRKRVYQQLLLDRIRGRGYPGSLMGTIALTRQTLLDAQWYAAAHDAYNADPVGKTRPEENLSLAALVDVVRGQEPVMIEASDELSLLRANGIIKEFKLNASILGNGYEYRQLTDLKSAGIPLVVPVNFPDPPDVESPGEALGASLEELSHWELAPENPKRLNDAGVTFALSSAKLKKNGNFHDKVRDAVERGLAADAALAALTTRPAAMLGMSRQLGTIQKGKLANLIAADGDIFTQKAKISDTWVRGVRYEIEKKPEVDPRGKWDTEFTLGQHASTKAMIEISGDVNKLKGKLTAGEANIVLQSTSLNYRRLTIVFPGDSAGFKGIVRMSGRVEDNLLVGRGEFPDGRSFDWRATRVSDETTAMKKKDKSGSEEKPASESIAMAYPVGAYGRMAPPEQPKHILIKGATIWTSGPEGMLEDWDMLVSDGKIAKLGQGLEEPSGAVVIQANGKHVTPGLIDAHSHTAISSGVNESRQAVTSEVGIEDVINSNDISIYRQLAGGLTMANQLHGSSNPIGGKSSVIKLRWGSRPDDLKYSKALPGIKFALGENVKRSNSRSPSSRYPQTRMGVEQIIRDRFSAAVEYEKSWKTYNATKDKKGVIPPRRDLELETLVEILNGKRFVHSHSYRQDEILMLMRVAEDFGFRIRVFQHVLEGYKIAEAMKAHGAMASTFSDWWAYKFEVIDAIPYNGALMQEVGVVVSYNSDSGELARRMNLEAAKAVKYGGVDPSEALKFVTLNPAKQLGVEKWVGSLQEGKDGDFVVWSGSPLSTYSICEQTWIEGKKYFDIQEDYMMREMVMAERARLIQKVMASKSNGRSGGQGGRQGRPTADISETIIGQEVEQ